MIEALGLSKAYTVGTGRKKKVVQAVTNVGWCAVNGQITGLLGPNGAGKTTTLRMVAGIVVPDAGQVLVDGLCVVNQRQRALGRMGVLSDARGLYPRLTAQENIVYFARLAGMEPRRAKAKAVELAQLLGMSSLLDRRTEGFSQGERMKTALARALVHDPVNLILDEPTNGLDVVATRALRETLRRLRDETGKCVVFCTHIMQEVERLCDQVVVVSRGSVVAKGSVSELKISTGKADFEDAFVELAFAQDEIAENMAYDTASGAAAEVAS